MPATTRMPGQDIYKGVPSEFFGAPENGSNTELADALRALTREVKALRDDLRREILQREVEKLPQPIQQKVK